MEEIPIWEICCVFKAPLVASLHFVALTHIVPKDQVWICVFPGFLARGWRGWKGINSTLPTSLALNIYGAWSVFRFYLFKGKRTQNLP